MPYTAEHRVQTRARIVECARQLFNRRGFSEVTIDQIMERAGLTRGGFYNHFGSKDDIYVEAIEAYAQCDPTERWPTVTIDRKAEGVAAAQQAVRLYLSREHLADLDGQCPMNALPSDIARASLKVRGAFTVAVHALAGMLTANPSEESDLDGRTRALGLAALCVGGMVLSRTVDDADFADEIRAAAEALALEVLA